MWRSKKFIIMVVAGALLVAGSIGGIAYAQAGNGDDGRGALLDRVCEIYQQKTSATIDQAALKDAFTQAMGEMRSKAPPDRFQTLVDEGKITQEQADQYNAWLNAKPDTASFEQQLKEWQQGRPDVPAELKTWLEARPKIPLGFGFRGHGGFPGMGGPGGQCPPAPEQPTN